jgi:hypothetical protein
MCLVQSFWLLTPALDVVHCNADSEVCRKSAHRLAECEAVLAASEVGQSMPNEALRISWS